MKIKLLYFFILTLFTSFGNMIIFSKVMATEHVEAAHILNVGDYVFDTYDKVNYITVNYINKGAFGEIYEVRPVNKDQDKKIALKVMLTNAKSIYDDPSALVRLYQADTNKVLLRESDSILMQLTTDDHSFFYGTFAPLMDGDLSDILTVVNLNEDTTNFNNKLNFINNVTDVLLNALEIFSHLDLVYSDLKLSNIFYSTEKGFDFKNLNLIDIKLADYNGVVENNSPILTYTEDNSSPQLFMSSLIHEMKANFFDDVYNLGVTIYTLIFGYHPLNMYIYLDQHNRSISTILTSKTKYDQYLNWINSNFNKLISKKSKNNSYFSLLQIERLKALVTGTMKWYPRDRASYINTHLKDTVQINNEGKLKLRGKINSKKTISKILCEKLLSN